MSEYQNLKHYTYRLYVALLRKHIKAETLTPSTEEEDGIKAYCVLTHAALEEYFEKLALYTLKQAYKKFKSKDFIGTAPANQIEVDELNKNINQLVKTLLLSTSHAIYSKTNFDALKEYKGKLELATQLHKSGVSLTQQNVVELTKKADSHATELIKEAIRYHEKAVSENHGASLKYILKLLVPVGIDIPNQLNNLNSLQVLATQRGNFAHSSGGISHISSSKDILKNLIDIMKLCRCIEDSIRSFHRYSTT